MLKLSKTVLMLCLTLSGALCYASGMAGTENEKGNDGTPIEVIESTVLSGMDKSNAIIPTLNGHMLFIMFNENLGQVAVEIMTVSGASVQCLSSPTPNGLQVYIPYAGNYIVTFTLPNGDVYSGEFTVSD